MEIKLQFKLNPEYRLMEQVREVLRYYHGTNKGVKPTLFTVLISSLG